MIFEIYLNLPKVWNLGAPKICRFLNTIMHRNWEIGILIIY